MGWFNGKGVYLHSKGQGIKPQKWGVCVVNSDKLIKYCLT